MNQELLTTGVALLGIGGVGALLRKIPQQIAGLTLSRLISTIRVSDQEDIYSPIATYLSAQELLVTARSVRGYGVYKFDRNKNEIDRRTDFRSTSPINLFRNGNRFYAYRITRSKTQRAIGNPYEEEVIVYQIGGDMQELQNLIDRIVADSRQRPGRINAYSLMPGPEARWSHQTPRAFGLDFLYLPTELAWLESDVTKFLGNQSWYQERGIPWRRGYLLYGPPGSGKSSLVAALAKDFRLPLYCLQFEDLQGTALTHLLASLPERCILLIEDIDTLYNGREPLGEFPAFSDLLNALDGALAGEGRLLFISTNHLEKLDSALIRPGRIDQQINLTWATPEQARGLFLRFYPDADELARKFEHIVADRQQLSMAKMQELLIQAGENPEQAIELICQVALQDDATLS